MDRCLRHHGYIAPSLSVVLDTIIYLIVISRTSDFAFHACPLRSPDGRLSEESLHNALNSRCARQIRLFQTPASRSNEFHFSQSRTIRDRSSVVPRTM